MCGCSVLYDVILVQVFKSTARLRSRGASSSMLMHTPLCCITSYACGCDMQVLPSEGTVQADMALDTGGRAKEVRFELRTDKGSYMVSIDPPAGELLQVSMLR